MDEVVTLKDVAVAASVSVVTVSRVFNNRGNISEEVRKRVLNAAEQLGYLGSKRYVSSLHQSRDSKAIKEFSFFFNVGRDVIASAPFWSHIIAGAEREARTSDIQLSFRFISDLLRSPDTFSQTIHEMKIDGIFLVGLPEPEPLRLIQQTQIPVLLVDADIPDQPVESVLPNYFEGARQAVQYLLQERHTQIAFISTPATEIYSVDLRLAGYRAALEQAGIARDDALYVTSTLSSEGIHFSLTAEGGYEACQRLLARQVPFSAIFCVNDTMAIGVLKALREAGKRVPEDISVIGFDDLDVASHLVPALTTVRVDKEALGSIAVRRLISRVESPGTPEVVTVTKVTLVKRQSVTRFSL